MNTTHVFNLLNAVFPGRPFYGARVRLLRLCGVHVGRNVRINAGTKFFYHNVHIGENSWIGPLCHFYSTPDATIEIGRNCDIAPEVAFVTGSHEVGDSKRRAGKGTARSIVVADGCWIGARVTILGGARIGAGTIIGAGSLILGQDYPQDVLIAGVPAEIKRELV